MKRRLILRREAENDFAAAYNGILLARPQAAQNFLDALEESLTLVEESPRAYAIRSNDVRRINLKGAPYGLLFRVVELDEEQELVVVLGLMHQNQDFSRFLTRQTP